MKNLLTNQQSLEQKLYSEKTTLVHKFALWLRNFIENAE